MFYVQLYDIQMMKLIIKNGQKHSKLKIKQNMGLVQIPTFPFKEKNSYYKFGKWET